MSSDIVIRVENLSKSYKLYDNPIDRLKESIHPLRKKYHRDFYALNNISFELRKGQCIGIIGKNGSGKSTLLKILSSVLTPTFGTAAVSGKVSSLLELGVGFNPELTGIENVYFYETILGFSKQEIDAKIENILAFADIGDFVYQPIKMYSSGMLVRLAFAAAVNIDPDILIVDEALAVGDIKFQRKCYAKFEEFRKAGKTILFVSHAMDTINLLCDTAIFIDNGRIVEQGHPKQVTRLYQKMMLGADAQEEKLAKKGNFSGNPQSGPAESPAGKMDGNAMPAIDAEDLSRLKEIARTRLLAGSSKKAEIIDYAIFDGAGKRVTVLECREKYTLMARVLFHADVAHIYIAFQIKTLKGLLLFAVNSAMQHIKIDPQHRCSIVEGRAEITTWLSPGNYFLSFRARTYDEVYDDLHDVVHFAVAGSCLQAPDSIVNLEPRISVQNILSECKFDIPSSPELIERGDGQ